MMSEDREPDRHRVGARRQQRGHEHEVALRLGHLPPVQPHHAGVGVPAGGEPPPPAPPPPPPPPRVAGAPPLGGASPGPAARPLRRPNTPGKHPAPRPPPHPPPPP